MKTQNISLSGWGNFPKSDCELLTLRQQTDFANGLEATQMIARGLGRSYADQATNHRHLVLDCAQLDKFISWDEESGVLACQAGVSLEDIILSFAPRGWFPMITPGTKFVTVGGCIANDIHGKAHHVDGSFYNCVEEISVLLANGEVMTASREQAPEFFKANFGGLGLLGIILTAKIRLRRIETSYFTQKAVSVRDLDELLDAFEQYDDDYNYSVAWVDSLARGNKLGRGVLSFSNVVTLDDLPVEKIGNPLKTHSPLQLSLPFFLPNASLNQWSIKMFNVVLGLVQSKAGSIGHYENLLFPLDVVRHWNRGYGKRGFIQYQFVIPMENGKENIRRLLETIASSGMSPFLNVLKKFGKGIGGLSFPMEGYTFAIDFPYHRDIVAFSRQLDKIVLECGGRIYLGKDALLEEQMFKQMYPQYTDWLEIKNQVDPNNKFQSDLSKRIGLTI